MDSKEIVNKLDQLSLEHKVTTTFGDETSEDTTRMEYPDAAGEVARVDSRDNKSATDSIGLEMAALQVHQKAYLKSCFELAWLFLAALGVEQSNQKALDYWQRVINSEESNDDAIIMLRTLSKFMVGLCHSLGVGTERNLVTGWRLLFECKSDEFVLAGRWALGWRWGDSIDGAQSKSHTSTFFFQYVCARSVNNSLLQHLEGVCYFYGFGTTKDQNKAVEVFASLADNGFAASQVFFGSCYMDGYGVGKSHETAVGWFRKSAEQGYAWGQFALGNCYFYGLGVPEDHAEAVELYRKAANQGHVMAQFNLGDCYERGQGVSQDYAKASERNEKAAEQGGAYSCSIAVDYSKGRQDYAKAVEWYQKAADQGFAKAQYILGVYYSKGRIFSQDYAKAVEWYQKAADQGYAKAQFNLARFYETGRGVTLSCTKAVEYFRKSADQGHTKAQYAIGVCYLNGFGVSQDYAKATEWYRMAANQGFGKAKTSLETISRRSKFSYTTW